MSHAVDVTMISDQEIEIKGRKVNIHDIKSIIVDPHGIIVDARIELEGEPYRGWLSEERR